MTLLFQMKVLYQHGPRFSMFHVKLFGGGEARKIGQNDEEMRNSECGLRKGPSVGGGLRPPPSFILSGDMIDAPSAHPSRLRRRGGYHPPSQRLLLEEKLAAAHLPRGGCRVRFHGLLKRSGAEGPGIGNVSRETIALSLRESQKSAQKTQPSRSSCISSMLRPS